MVNCGNSRKRFFHFRPYHAREVFLDMHRNQAFPVMARCCVHWFPNVQWIPVSVVFNQICAHKAVSVGSVHGIDGCFKSIRTNIFRLLRVVLNQIRCHNATRVLRCNSLIWLACVSDMTAACMVALDQMRSYEHLVSGSCHSMYRVASRCSNTVAGICRRKWCQQWVCQLMLSRSHNRWHRFIDIMNPWSLSISLSISGRH